MKLLSAKTTRMSYPLLSLSCGNNQASWQLSHLLVKFTMLRLQIVPIASDPLPLFQVLVSSKDRIRLWGQRKPEWMCKERKKSWVNTYGWQEHSLAEDLMPYNMESLPLVHAEMLTMCAENVDRFLSWMITAWDCPYRDLLPKLNKLPLQLTCIK